MKVLARGAEAVLYLDEQNRKVIKDRIKKSYRIPQIDEALRKQRTAREAKILQKLTIKAPQLLKTDNRQTLEIGFIEGKRLKEILDQKPELAKIIGAKTAELHNANIIHGDLTTSNMILGKKDNDIYFIDFGLSFFSSKIEDKAVDIHLFRQALESKHYRVCEKAFAYFLRGYKQVHHYNEILGRFKVVESRGRNKEKF